MDMLKSGPELVDELIADIRTMKKRPAVEWSFLLQYTCKE
jgi:hypothetical protein